MTLEEATDKVSKLADKESGQLNATINFSFNEGQIHLDDTVSPAEVSNENRPAQCTLIMSLDNFNKLLNGDLNPMMAFMSGKMKVEGDKGVAMKLASIF